MEEHDWLDYLVAIGTLATPLMGLTIGAILWKYQRSFESNIRLEEQHRDDRREHRNWLRDQRLSAYVDLTKHLLSFGLSRGAQHDNPFEGYVVVSRAMLLAHDEDLTKKIDLFIVDLDRFLRLQNEGKDNEEKNAEAEALYKELWHRARDIVGSLRTSLAQK